MSAPKKKKKSASGRSVSAVSRVKTTYIIGVDEVGRGPLAGPVTVGAVIIPVGLKFKIQHSTTQLKDSKKLSEKQRNEWFKWAKEQQREKKFFYAFSKVSSGIIDRINISKAANLAAERAIKMVIKKSGVSDKDIKMIYLDGGLYPRISTKKYKQKTIIRGDEKISVISLASICAKVSRDADMTRFAVKYPEYGFEVHKGYGTAHHIKMLKKHGLSPIHRLMFVRFLKGGKQSYKK